jgi:hypothetical protein
VPELSRDDDLAFRAVLGDTFALYRHFFRHFVAIALPIFLLVDVLPAIGTTSSSDTARGLWIIAALIAALVAAADDVRDGRVDTSVGALLAAIRDKLPALVGAAFLAGLLICVPVVAVVAISAALHVVWLGVILSFAAGFYVLIRWSLIVPFIVLEGKGITDALRGSWGLVTGHWWRTLGVLVVTGLITGSAGGILSRVLQSVLPGFMGTWLGPAVSSALTAPLSALALTVLYFKLRARRDGPPPAASP